MRRLLAACAIALGAAGVQAGPPPPKVALLIGNAAYADAPLRNPLNDVREVAAQLRRLGFAVTTHENLRQGEMRDALRRFVLEHREAQLRLVYYAGHGLQLRGRSYLLPVGVRIASESDVLERTADATELAEALGQIEHGANIVVIDACRVHPMFAGGTRRMWAVKPGLSRLPAPTGTLVAFSTRPGHVARDGEGSLGVYARHFTQALKDAPELPVEAFFKRVRSAVASETRRQQVPWESSDLDGELCFRPEASGRCAGGR